MKPISHYVVLFFIIYVAVVLGIKTAAPQPAIQIDSGVSIPVEDTEEAVPVEAVTPPVEYTPQAEIRAEDTNAANELKYLDLRQQALNKQMDEQLENQIEQEQDLLDDEISSKNNQVAQKLARHCYEWTQADEQMKNEVSEQGRNKFCNAYKEFLDSGKLPDFNVD